MAWESINYVHGNGTKELSMTVQIAKVSRGPKTINFPSTNTIGSDNAPVPFLSAKVAGCNV